MSKDCLNFSNPFSLFFGPIYRPRIVFNVFWSCTADGESGRETGQKLLQIVGETDSPEPVTGVTGCDGLHVTGDDGL